MTLLERLLRAKGQFQPSSEKSQETKIKPLAKISQTHQSKVEESIPGIPANADTCAGCFGNWFKKMVDLGHGAFNVARFAAQAAAGQLAAKEIQEQREKICRECPLFTVVKEGVYSCGKPATQKVFRIRSKDGCGCWLNLKWTGPSEKCPLDPPKW